MAIIIHTGNPLLDGDYGLFTVSNGIAVINGDGISDGSIPLAALEEAEGSNGDVVGKTGGVWTAVNPLPTVPGLIKGNVTDGTYTIVLKLRRNVTVNSFVGQLATGTCTIAVTIDGVNVGTLSGISQTTAESSTTATSPNSAVIGQALAIVISSAAGATDLSFQIELNYV